MTIPYWLETLLELPENLRSLETAEARKWFIELLPLIGGFGTCLRIRQELRKGKHGAAVEVIPDIAEKAREYVEPTRKLLRIYESSKEDEIYKTLLKGVEELELALQEYDNDGGSDIVACPAPA